MCELLGILWVVRKSITAIKYIIVFLHPLGTAPLEVMKFIHLKLKNTPSFSLPVFSEVPASFSPSSLLPFSPSPLLPFSPTPLLPFSPFHVVPEIIHTHPVASHWKFQGGAGQSQKPKM